MIGMLCGTIEHVGDGMIIVLVNGVGYRIHTNITECGVWCQNGIEVEVCVSTVAKDGGTKLYGFCSYKDVALFEKLIRCDGVGPKTAQRIVEHITFGGGVDSIGSSLDWLSDVPGVGPKTAGKLKPVLSKIFTQKKVA